MSKSYTLDSKKKFPGKITLLYAEDSMLVLKVRKARSINRLLFIDEVYFELMRKTEFLSF